MSRFWSRFLNSNESDDAPDNTGDCRISTQKVRKIREGIRRERSVRTPRGATPEERKAREEELEKHVEGIMENRARMDQVLADLNEALSEWREDAKKVRGAEEENE